ncbi:MAG TPA: tRNA (adenosine(37)-N6)-dimethylallyltransferase MiaA [Vicinamibacterales bacterium]
MSGASAGADGPPRGEGGVVPVICGPTAAGKSAIALGLAERYGRSILVADSRQIYRRFDVGTAKPTPDEQRRISHHGIDLVEPTERFSAARWAEAAEASLRAAAPGRTPIVVGGTGLYLRALFEGLFDDPSAADDRRTALLAWLDSRETGELRRWAERLDPSRAHLGRTQLLRALSVALLSGRPISELHLTRARRSAWRPRYLVIDPGPALHRRVADRLDEMFRSGWVEEVRSLSDIPDEAPAWKSTGYRRIRDVVRGTMTETAARERVLIDTRQYAKRQRTWFRHQLPADVTTRLDPTAADATDRIEQWWGTVHRRRPEERSDEG